LTVAAGARGDEDRQHWRSLASARRAGVSFGVMRRACWSSPRLRAAWRSAPQRSRWLGPAHLYGV